MTNKTVTIHTFIDWAISTDNITDSSVKRWHLLHQEQHLLYFFWWTTKVLWSLIWNIHTHVENKPKPWKPASFLVFQSHLFPLFSGMVCKGQQEVRVRAPEWNSCGWFRVSNCCSSECNSSLEPHPAKKVGLTPFCCRSLPDQWEHPCCHNWDLWVTSV